MSKLKSFLDEWVILAADALKRDLAASGHKKAILMVHDWGAVVSLPEAPDIAL